VLYELTLSGTYFNQQVINRFNYVSTGTPASVMGSFALMSAFGLIPELTVYPATAPFAIMMYGLADDFVINSAVVRAAALYAPEDFYERPFITPYAGTNAGEPLSPAMAFGFRTNRVRLDIDRGTKRLCGVTETQVGAGGVLVSGTMDQNAIIAEKWSEVLEYDDEGATLSFTPCIVSKEEYTTPAGKKAYKYYPTLAEQMEHVATSIIWQPYSTVRTQNSRQYGRGV